MAKCADSNCGYYWQDEDEEYPRCHYDDSWPAPCEYDEEEDPFNENDPYVITNPMAFY